MTKGVYRRVPPPERRVCAAFIKGGDVGIITQLAPPQSTVALREPGSWGDSGDPDADRGLVAGRL